jgi:Kef-type K+ transport system membrane component KefB
LRWIDADGESLRFLSEIGFAMLMLIAGTHLPLRNRGLRSALGAGALATALTFALAFPVAKALAEVTPLHDAGILTLLLATSSAAIVMPVLADRGGAGAGSLCVIAWVAIADVATVIAIPIVLARGNVGRVIAGSALVLAGAAVLYLLAREADRHGVLHRAGRASLSRGWALRLRLSLVALFTLAWIATSYGTSVLIAGFSTGAVIAMLGEPRSVARELIGVGEGFLVPLFFVTLGARLDVRALFSDPANVGLLGALLGAIVAVHLVVALVCRMGPPAGLIASAQLGVPSAIVSVGLTSGTLAPGQGAAIITAAIASVGVSAAGAARLRGPVG